MSEASEISAPNTWATSHQGDRLYPVSIKGTLFTPQGDIVLLLNEREEWELPGGRIEPGESPSACLEREIREELNLNVSVGASIDTYLFEVIPQKYVFIATYRCALIGALTPTVSHEHKRIGVFPLQSLPANLPEGYRNSIMAASGLPLTGHCKP